MARTQYTVNRVRSEEDRSKFGGAFIQLKKVGDTFEGYALFKPDPELDDNPGYYEYFEHYTPSTGYVPCAGEDCVLCEEGDRPSTRAKALFLIDDEVKAFTLNWNMIQEFVSYMKDGDPIAGQLIRVRRLDDRGKYSIRIKNEKITKTDTKKHLKDAPDLEKQLTNQLARAMEEMDVSEAMAEDDAEGKAKDDDEPKESARKGKKKSKDEEPEEVTSLEDERVTITKVTKKENTLDVESEEHGDLKLWLLAGEDEVDDYSKGDEVVVTAELDKEGDLVVSEIAVADAEPDPEPEPDAELPKAIEDETFEVVEVNHENETIDVKNDEYEFTLYFLAEGDASDVDFDEYEEGQEITISAAKDNEGDMVATAIPEAVESKAKGKKKTTSGSKKK